jgi:hypothetical protein
MCSSQPLSVRRVLHRRWVATQLIIVLIDLLLIVVVPAVPVAIAWYVQVQRAASTTASPLNEISADDILYQPWTLTNKYHAIMVQNIGLSSSPLVKFLCLCANHVLFGGLNNSHLCIGGFVLSAVVH